MESLSQAVPHPRKSADAHAKSRRIFVAANNVDSILWQAVRALTWIVIAGVDLMWLIAVGNNAVQRPNQGA
jgi:hypothetical protein